MQKLDLRKIKKKLPKYPGILGKDEYFNSAVLIPLIKIDDEYHLLFEKRAANIRQGGEICFPGGEFDPELDKNYKNTAVRETMEELGIDKKEIDVIGEMDTFVGPMGVTVNTFIAEIKSSEITKFKIDKTEVEKIFTVPVSFFTDNPPENYQLRVVAHPSYVNDEGLTIDLFPVKELNLPEKYHSPREWQHKVIVYKAAGEVIWGITAIIIKEFVKLIK